MTNPYNCLRIVACTAALALALAAPAAAQTQPVSIRFAAMVGDQPFACGKSYDGIGTTNSRVTPSDFRFYVSDVRLLRTDGTAVPVQLDQDDKWQYRDVALLDFENASGPCLTGTPDTRDVVAGSVPAGSYTGLQFTLGLPFDLNHGDATLAPSPLNLTSLFWNWRAGHKFLRIDMATSALPQNIAAGDTPRFGDPRASLRLGFAIHLGSTACEIEGQTAAQPMPAGGTMPPTVCRNPNRVTVTLANFDPAKNIVVADLKALLEKTNVDTNQADSPAGCMSSPNDGDCGGLMSAFGLSFAGQPAGQQRFFRAQ